MKLSKSNTREPLKTHSHKEVSLNNNSNLDWPLPLVNPFIHQLKNHTHRLGNNLSRLNQHQLPSHSRSRATKENKAFTLMELTNWGDQRGPYP